MIPSTQVRISRPPATHPEWENVKGRVESLIPSAPLRYRVRLATNERAVLLGDCLDVLDYQEELVGNDTIIVNGLMYCRPHRLEVCGSCGLDHRMTNFSNEIADSELAGSVRDRWEIVDSLIDQLSVPPRKAPNKASRGQFALRPEYKPVVNDAIKLIPENFNPESLEQWPRGKSLYSAVVATFGQSENKQPEDSKLPLRRMRETIAVLGKRWADWLQVRQPNDPMVRILLQDEAQSQAITLDLVEPIYCYEIGGFLVPLFVVRYSRITAGDRDGVVHVTGTMERGTQMGEIEVEVDEMNLMVEVLKANSLLLDSSFMEKHTKYGHILSLGVLTAIPFALEQNFYRLLGDYCHQCGTSGCKALTCSRCKKVQYCSKECQKKNWKHHKSTCKAP